MRIALQLLVLLLFVVLSVQQELHTAEKFRTAINSAKSSSPPNYSFFNKEKEGQKKGANVDTGIKYDIPVNRVRKEFNPKERLIFW